MSLTVSSGQIVSATSASPYIGSGTVENGGSLIVVSGGDINYVVVQAGGSATVLSGGQSFFTTVDGGGVLTISSGGGPFLDLDTVVLAGGVEQVLFSGTATSSFLSGGIARLAAGAVASAVSATAGGTQVVSLGATAIGTELGSGGMLEVLNGGTAVDTNSAPNFAGPTGVAGSAVVSAGGSLSATSGSYVESVTVLAGGSVSIAGGGAIKDSVLDGVTLSLGSRAFGFNNTLSGGGETITSGGGDSFSILLAGATASVLGGSASDLTLSGATMTVLSGGTVASTRVSAGGLLIVGTSGSATLDGISAGGSETVSSGGAVSLQYDGGAQTISAGGVASGTNVATGGTQTVLLSGIASATSVSGGTQMVSSGGLAIDTTVNGGSAVISAGGTLEVLAGHTARGVTLLSGAILLADSGSTLQASEVGSAATLAVSAGVSELATLVLDGGYEAVGSGVIATSVTVMRGGSQTVFNGGTADNTMLGGYFDPSTGSPTSTLQPGGAQYISSGGHANDTTIDAGGVQTIFTSGIASFTLVSTGGQAVVSNGGTLSAVVVDAGGSVVISAGGVDLGGQLGAPGASIPSEFGISGGSASVLSGGTASGLAVYSGGMLSVAAGGSVINPLIGGGTLDLAVGASVSGTISFAAGIGGGELVINSTVMPTAPIGSLGPNDTIDLAGIPFASGASVVLGANDVLSITEGGHTYDLNLISAGLGGQAITLAAAPGGGGTLIEVACYAAGSRIATPTEMAPVETLRPGDSVLAWQDGAWRPAPVRWVGQRTVDLARHPRPQQAAPIRIAAGAIAEGVPCRDLLLSPDHAVLIDAALIQAQALLNGITVTQQTPPQISYWHVELDQHGLLLAEGLAAESYLDTGNRALFAGESGATPLHPDLASAAAWTTRGCAPLHLADVAVTAAHARVLLRALADGHMVTADPDLIVLADGATVLAGASWCGCGDPATWDLPLPAGTRRLRLISRRFVPAWFAEPDRRQLGVAVAALTVAGRRLPRAAFASGWHAQERHWRWTNGDAVIELKPARGTTTLRLTLAAAGARYWTAPALPRRRDMAADI